MADIYIVTVTLKGPSQTQLMFNRNDKAIEAFSALSLPGGFYVEAQDDFGTRLYVSRESLMSVHFCDFTQQQAATREVQLATARSNAKVQKMASEDPLLKILAPNFPPNQMLRA